MDATHRSAFEAGIKLGTLYHQFIGTPVSPETARGLAKAMADAIEQQPGCERASVELNHERIAADRNRFGYAELAGEHLSAEVLVEHEGTRARAELALEDGYPMMRLVSIEEPSSDDDSG